MSKLKSFLFIAAMLVAVSASAQLSFGVKAGLNLSNISGDGESLDSKIGFKIGPTVEFAIAPNMAIQSGLLLSSKGAKTSESYSESGIDVDADITINANYLELPICFAYKYPIAPDTKIYVNAGPYLAYGLFGKTTAKISAMGLSAEEDEDTLGDDGFENFDFGLTFGIGAEVTKFNFGLNYDLGLSEVIKDSKIKNTNFWISVGYNF